MKHKRVVAFIVILALIISALPVVSLAEETQPVFEVIGSTIKNDNEFFELTMKVTPGSKGFFSAGMVLQYDKSVITPVAWDSAGTAVPMESCNNWQNVAAVPAVCPTEISGKTALAYEDTAENMGYLYISAETALPVSTLPNGGKILTVRFKYAGSDDTAIAASKQKVIDGFANKIIVSLASDDISAASPAGQMVFYGAGDEDETEYYYTADNYTTAGIKHDELLTEPPKFTLAENADSANTGGETADASDFVAIVFFDWDASTLLGSITAPKGSDASAEVKAFEDTLKDQTPRNSLYSSDESKPLTNKKGYSFESVWLDFNSDMRTHYGATVTTGVTIPKPEGVSFASLTDSIVVKACYGSNEEIAAGAPTNMYYTTKITGYDRFGTTNSYSVKIQVKRENESEQGVPRVGTPALRVVMNTNTTPSSAIYTLYSLENKDEATVEVAPNANISSIRCNVIDTYGITNWVGTAVRNANLDENQGTVEGKDGFMFNGNLRYVNSLLEEANETGKAPSFAQTVLTTNLGLDIKDPGTGKNITIANLRTYLLSAWKSKNPDGIQDLADLTWDEMQYAIHNKGALT